MMKLGWAVLRRILVSLVLALLVLCALGLWTPIGVRMGLWLARVTLPGAMSYKDVSGSWMTTVSVAKLSYQSQGVQLRAGHLDLAIDLKQLIRQRVWHIKSFHAQQLFLHVAKFAKSKSAHKVFYGSVVVDQAVVTRARLSWPGVDRPLDVTRAQLKGAVASSPLGTTFHMALEANGPKFKAAVTGKKQARWQVHYQFETQAIQLKAGHSWQHLKVTGQVSGQVPQLSGQLQMQDIQWGSRHIKELLADWQVPTQAGLAATVQVRAHSISGVRGLSDATFLVQRKKGVYHGQIRMQGGQQSLVLAWQATHRKLWRAQWQSGRWLQPPLLMTLARPVDITFQPDGVTWTPIQIHGLHNGRLDIQGQWRSDKPWRINTNLSKVSGAWLLRMLNISNVQCQTKLSMEATLRGTGRRIKRSQWRADLSRGWFAYHHGTETTSWPMASAHWQGVLQKNKLQTSGLLQSGSGDTLKAQVQLMAKKGKPLWVGPTLAGQWSLHVHQLAWLATLIPHIAPPSGGFKGLGTVSGTLNHPIMHGQLQLEKAKVSIPDLNIQAEHIQLQAKTVQGVLHYKLEGQIQGKTLHAQGTTQLRGPNFESKILITGQDVPWIQTNNYQLTASPKLSVLIQRNHVLLTGSILIPKGKIQPVVFDNIETLSHDVVWVGREVPHQFPWKVTMRLDLIAGKQVFVDTHGATGFLRGRVRILRAPGATFLATGRLHLIQGLYKVSGQTLQITPDSTVVYHRTPLLNPVLAIRAVPKKDTFSSEQSNQVSVGVLVRGTFKKPLMTLYASDPRLTQAQILSYLVLGHSSDFQSSDRINLLMQALNGLKLKKSDQKGILQGLGITELGVERQPLFGAMTVNPAASTSQSLVIGRQLGHRLSLRYLVGLSQNDNLIQIRYRLFERWLLQVQSTVKTTDSGVDILYSFSLGQKKTKKTEAKKPHVKHKVLSMLGVRG